VSDRDEAALLQEMLAELQHIKTAQAEMLRLTRENSWPRLSDYPFWKRMGLSLWLFFVVVLPILAVLTMLKYAIAP
jgi:hypothetical protein